jgi:hypothetical protein
MASDTRSLSEENVFSGHDFNCDLISWGTLPRVRIDFAYLFFEHSILSIFSILISITLPDMCSRLNKPFICY